MPRAESDQEKEANEKALREVQEAPQEDSDEVLELKEPDDDDDDGAAPEPEAATSQRKEKKANRYKELGERATRAEQEAAELRARLAAQDEIRRALPQQPEPEQKDPHKEKVSALRKQQNDLAADFDRMTPEGKRESLPSFRQRWQDLDTDIQTTIAEGVAARSKPQGGVDPQRAAEIAALRIRYADVVSHPKGEAIVNWAGGQWQSLHARARAMGQAQPGQAEMDRLMDEGRRVFGLSKPPPASRGTQARFAGSGPRSAAPPRDDSEPFQINSNLKTHKKMAAAAFPSLSPEKALQKYMNLLKDA